MQRVKSSDLKIKREKYPLPILSQSFSHSLTHSLAHRAVCHMTTVWSWKQVLQISRSTLKPNAALFNLLLVIFRFIFASNQINEPIKIKLHAEVFLPYFEDEYIICLCSFFNACNELYISFSSNFIFFIDLSKKHKLIIWYIKMHKICISKRAYSMFISPHTYSGILLLLLSWEDPSGFLAFVAGRYRN